MKGEEQRRVYNGYHPQGEGSPKVIHAAIQRDMMHMISVGNKWWSAFYNTYDKYSECVENRNDQQNHYDDRRIEVGIGIVQIANVKRQEFNRKNQKQITK